MFHLQSIAAVALTAAACRLYRSDRFVVCVCVCVSLWSFSGRLSTSISLPHLDSRQWQCAPSAARSIAPHRRLRYCVLRHTTVIKCRRHQNGPLMLTKCPRFGYAKNDVFDSDSGHWPIESRSAPRYTDSQISRYAP